ncbi:MAG: STAS domain-containing protein [Thermodesulfovibrionales bacterium]|jgi:anti-anti-sigma regulatory factor
MLSFSFQRQQGAGILTFSGDISSHHNEDFKSALMISISNSDKVVVNFDEVSAFDRICVQTFCAAVKIAKRLKKELTFSMVAMTEQARHNGLACSIMGCGICGRKGCLLSQSAAMEAMS